MRKYGYKENTITVSPINDSVQCETTGIRKIWLSPIKDSVQWENKDIRKIWLSPIKDSLQCENTDIRKIRYVLLKIVYNVKIRI